MSEPSTDILADLEGLLKRATTEHSHYCVAVKRAITEIERLRTAVDRAAGVLLTAQSTSA